MFIAHIYFNNVQPRNNDRFTRLLPIILPLLMYLTFKYYEVLSPNIHCSVRNSQLEMKRRKNKRVLCTKVNDFISDT